MKDGASREGLPRRLPGMLVIIDATEGPVTFHHELATVPAVQRFNLPDGKDFVLAQGYRAVIEYDEWEARNKILQVLPIPPVTETL
jgi:hypothetical protein